MPVQARGEERAPQEHSHQPLLLLSFLLPAAAAIGYPFRHRIYAAAGTALPALVEPAECEADRTVQFTYRPAVDPFRMPVLGLTGPGAADTARVTALAALEGYGDSALLVIPRPDATALFGLAEDESLDEHSPQLFIPGNLDTALAYLETELAIRQGTADPKARRLLLVADCADEAGRIRALLTRHPGGVSAILLGAWPGDRAAVDDDGLIDASPGLAAHLPERFPAMSRTEARDRLRAAIEPGQPPRRSRSGRRSKSGSRRG